MNPGAPSSSSARSSARPSPSPWRSRGYLPHFDAPQAIQAITFRLADSLPREVLARIDREIAAEPETRKATERRKHVDALMDAGHGSCILAHPRAAKTVQDALLHFDGVRYQLLAWVVMPNHVHTLIEPLNPWGLAKIVQSWKSYTGRWIREHWQELSVAKSAGLELGAPRVWQREYWDRFIRDERHYQATIEYIHNNPVKAGLVPRAEDWPWSSAKGYSESARAELELSAPKTRINGAPGRDG